MLMESYVDVPTLAQIHRFGHRLEYGDLNYNVAVVATPSTYNNRSGKLVAS